MSRFLTIEEVVENVMLSIDGVDSRDKVVFRQWVYIAMRQIGFSDLSIDTECVEVCDLSFRKPDNLVSTIEVSLSDGLNPIRYKYVQNQGLLCIDETAVMNLGFGRIILSEDADFYHLSSNGSTVVQADIKFYGLPVNEDGELVIPERDLFSIMSFVEFMYIKRKRISNPREISNSDLSEFKDMWLRELMKAKGRNKMPSIHQASAIAKMWMSMIQKPNFKN